MANNRFPPIGRIALLLAGLVTLSAQLPAHGGQFRGPLPVPGRYPQVPGLRTPGGQVVPPRRPGLPTTPSSGVPLDVGAPSPWRVWWDLHEDLFLELRGDRTPASLLGDEARPGSTTARDEKAAPAGPFAQPSADDVATRIVPALKRMLEERGDNRDIATACAVALARLDRAALGGGAFDRLAVFRRMLLSGTQEIRETGALCLGLCGEPAGLELAAEVLADTTSARRLADRNSIDERTRAFAAYGLGIAAGRSDDAGVKKRAWEALSPGLRASAQRDLHSAVVTAVGLLAPRPWQSAREKRLYWMVLHELESYLADPDAGRALRSDRFVAAQIPLALARLVGDQAGEDRERVLGLLMEILQDRRQPPLQMVQSLTVALGEIGRPEDEGLSELLEKVRRRAPDQTVEQFATIALGRIGGAANRDLLLRILGRGSKTDERPWAALALGTMAWEARKAGATPDVTVARALADQLEDVRNQEVRGAFALAIGLTGDAGQADGLAKLLDDKDGAGEFTGDLALALGLLRAQEAAPLLRRVMRDADRRPEILQPCAVALALLGDAEAPAALIAMMADSGGSAMRLAGPAGAFRQVGGRESIDGLLDVLSQDSRTALAQAFVCAALGGIADPWPLPFNSRIGAGGNIHIAPPTMTDGLQGILDIL